MSTDREPQPEDGPDYHAEHASWQQARNRQQEHYSSVTLSDLEWKEIMGALTLAEIMMERKSWKESQVKRIRNIKHQLAQNGH